MALALAPSHPPAMTSLAMAIAQHMGTKRKFHDEESATDDGRGSHKKRMHGCREGSGTRAPEGRTTTGRSGRRTKTERPTATEALFSVWTDAPESPTVWSLIIDAVLSTLPDERDIEPECDDGALSVARTLVSLGAACRATRERVRAARIQVDALSLLVCDSRASARSVLACHLAVPGASRSHGVLDFTVDVSVESQIDGWPQAWCLAYSGPLCCEGLAREDSGSDRDAPCRTLRFEMPESRFMYESVEWDDQTDEDEDKEDLYDPFGECDYDGLHDDTCGTATIYAEDGSVGEFRVFKDRSDGLCLFGVEIP